MGVGKFFVNGRISSCSLFPAVRKAEHNLKSNYLKALESKEKLVESACSLGEGETGSYARKVPSLWLVDKN